jgi:ABC-2 type transport system permease protein
MTGTTTTSNSSPLTMIRAEALKLRTLRPTWVFATLALVAGAVIGAAKAQIAGTAHETISLPSAALGPTDVVWFLAIVVAILAAAGEFQYHSIRTTLLASPRRGRVLGAKAAVAGTGGALLVTLGAVAATVAAGVTAGISNTTVAAGDLGAWGHVIAAVALGGLWAVVATGLGMLTRSTAAAITAVLLWRFVGEVLVPMLSRRPGLVRWMPSDAGDALVGFGGNHLPAAGAASLLLGFTAAICGAAALLFVRRDAA